MSGILGLLGESAKRELAPSRGLLRVRGVAGKAERRRGVPFIASCDCRWLVLVVLDHVYRRWERLEDAGGNRVGADREEVGERD